MKNRERTGVFMEDYGFNGGGWYSHDGEGKGMCTGPGCNCDEKNYGSHSSSSNGNISIFGAILCTIGGLIGTALLFALIGVEDAPTIVIIILWVIVSTALSVVASKIGL
jgi:hypothetical protein